MILERRMNRTLKVALLVVIGAVLFIGAMSLLLTAYLVPVDSEVNGDITNFEECAAAGYPIGESYPRQCWTPDGSNFVEDVSELSVEEYFAGEIWQRGVDNLGAIPIEGFTPELYIGAFPELKEEDFDGVDAINGHYEFENGELEFVMLSDELITSADGTVTEEGLGELLDNLEERLGIEANTQRDVDRIFVLIRGDLKLEFCPDEWIDNRMPVVGDSEESREYFIVDGERRELAEFNVEWVESNCDLERQVVY